MPGHDHAQQSTHAHLGRGVALRMLTLFKLRFKYHIALMFLKHQKMAHTATRWMVMLYGVWNLDFFRSFNLGICLGIDTIQALALELAVGVYPLLLLLATYVLIHLYDRNFKPIVIIWKPVEGVLQYTKKKIKTRTTLVDAFALFSSCRTQSY